MKPKSLSNPSSKITYKSLYPLPGGKGGKSKYAMLRPLPTQTEICEPFMGAAGVSVGIGLPTILGEINVSQRAIATVPSCFWKSRRYATDYRAAQSEFLAGVDLVKLFSYIGQEKSQTTLREQDPGIYDLLTDRWHALTSRLFALVSADEPEPGLYSFCQRSCFGNVMRLNPKGTAFNVSWHVDKLLNAVRFDPNHWAEWLYSRQWNPRVYSSWQGAISAVKRPNGCYLLLDPPYIEDEDDRKMTSAYVNHRVTTDDGRAYTYALAVEPLKVALNRGFPLIHLTNYYSAKLDSEVTQMAHDAGYICNRQAIGVCGAMGNSNGRKIHGDRVDSRPRPVEYCWEFQPFNQLNLFTIVD